MAKDKPETPMFVHIPHEKILALRARKAMNDNEQMFTKFVMTEMSISETGTEGFGIRQDSDVFHHSHSKTDERVFNRSKMVKTFKDLKCDYRISLTGNDDSMTELVITDLLHKSKLEETEIVDES